MIQNQYEMRAQERLDDLEDMEYAERQLDKQRAHEIKIMKLKRTMYGRQHTLRKLIKLPAVCLAVIGSIILTLFKRELPESFYKLLEL